MEEGEPGVGHEPSPGQSVYIGAGMVSVAAGLSPVQVKTSPSIPIVLTSLVDSSQLSSDGVAGSTAVMLILTPDAVVAVPGAGAGAQERETSTGATGVGAGGGNGRPFPSTVTVVGAHKPGSMKTVDLSTMVVSLNTVSVIVDVTVLVGITRLRCIVEFVAAQGVEDEEDRAGAGQLSAIAFRAKPRAKRPNIVVDFMSGGWGKCVKIYL